MNHYPPLFRSFYPFIPLSSYLFILFFFSSLLVSPGIFSQECHVFKGVVTDAEDGVPLVFAQIALQGTTMGTVTNDDGFFRLATGKSRNHQDTLIVTYLGYAVEKVPLARWDSGIRAIKMKPSPFQLNEFEVVGFTVEEVLKRVMDSIPVNYGTDSVILTAFIRTQKLVNTRMAEFTEALVENLKDGYYPYKPGAEKKKKLQSNIPRLYKGRVTSDTNLVNLLGEVGANARCLGCNFSTDIAEFPYETILDQRLWKHYEWHMQELSAPEGGKLYRIRFDQKPGSKKMLHQGELLINGRDFAIIQYRYKPSYRAFDAYEKQKYKRTWYLNHEPGWIQEMPLGETTVSYTYRGDHWVLNTVRREYRVTYTYPEKRHRIVYTYKNDVVITDISRDPEAVRAFDGDKSLGANQRWDEVVGETDEAFWQGFNYLPVEKALKKEVGEMGERQSNNRTIE